MTRSGLKRWRLPGTEIDFVQLQDGPRAGEYVVSAETVDRLPEFYQKVESAVKPGPARRLIDVYRGLSGGRVSTVYEAFSSSPIGLAGIIPNSLDARHADMGERPGRRCDRMAMAGTECRTARWCAGHLRKLSAVAPNSWMAPRAIQVSAGIQCRFPWPSFSWRGSLCHCCAPSCASATARASSLTLRRQSRFPRRGVVITHRLDHSRRDDSRFGAAEAQHTR